MSSLSNSIETIENTNATTNAACCIHDTCNTITMDEFINMTFEQDEEEEAYAQEQAYAQKQAYAKEQENQEDKDFGYNANKSSRQREREIEQKEHDAETEKTIELINIFMDEIKYLDEQEIRKRIQILQPHGYDELIKDYVNMWDIWKLNQLKKKLQEVIDTPTWLQRAQERNQEQSFKPIELQPSYDDAAKKVLNDTVMNFTRMSSQTVSCSWIEQNEKETNQCAQLEKELEKFPYVWEKPQDEEEICRNGGTVNLSICSISYEKQLQEWNEQVENHRQQKHELLHTHIAKCNTCWINYKLK